MPRVTLDEKGVVGDSHRGLGHRQVSLLSFEDIKQFSEDMGRAFKAGEFAENITTSGIDLRQCVAFDRLTIGEAELEVTQIGKTCHGDSCAIFREVGKCIMPETGVFCRVIAGGQVTSGDPIVLNKVPLRFEVVTLSERAAAGVYEDKSGARIEALLDRRYLDSPQRIEVHRQVLPDDPETLEKALLTARDSDVNVVITTGSTGVGPRDIAPDVVGPLADKTVPGIMDAIRLKYGADNPKALLSRSVAVVMGNTLVYCLPGSPRAVEEYMAEILKTLEHILFMLREWDVHAR